MRLRTLPAAAVVAALVAGCGDPTGSLKGRVVENGQPTDIPPQAALMFTLLKDDKPDSGKSFTTTVAADGTFELLASGGKLSPGKYMVTIETPAGGKTGLAKYKSQYKYPTSPLRADIVTGPNDVTIDLAKPNG